MPLVFNVPPAPNSIQVLLVPASNPDELELLVGIVPLIVIDNYAVVPGDCSDILDEWEIHYTTKTILL